MLEHTRLHFPRTGNRRFLFLEILLDHILYILEEIARLHEPGTIPQRIRDALPLPRHLPAQHLRTRTMLAPLHLPGMLTELRIKLLEIGHLGP